MAYLINHLSFRSVDGSDLRDKPLSHSSLKTEVYNDVIFNIDSTIIVQL
jgi:hypothetical protein